MGLAASQARFLAITARKANCEFQSLQIAQQKLSLSRDMEKISDEYQNAINQTTLVWDPDGNGTDLYELSYSLMMQPSELNNYLPYMVSRRDGKIALNAEFAEAAKAAGIGEDGFNGDRTTAFTAFINALHEQNALSLPLGLGASTLTYIPGAGLGGELLGREYSNNVTLTSLISYVDMISEVYAEGMKSQGHYYEQGEDMWFDFTDDSIYAIAKNTNPSYKNEAVILQNGAYNNDSFNLADLLNEDITLLQNGEHDYSAVIKALKDAIKIGADTGKFSAIINEDVADWYKEVSGVSFDSLQAEEQVLVGFFDKLAKSMYTLLMPEEPLETDITAFYLALDDLIARLDPRNLRTDFGGKWKESEGDAKEAVRQAENYNGWVKKGKYFTLSLSNLTETFLTNFVNGMNGFSDEYNVFDRVRDSYYITDDPGYIYSINNKATTESEDQLLFLSEFYSVMFNTICQNGWYENEYVDDEDYLSNALKNAQLFVVSKGADNYFYQERYVAIEGGHIMENTDDDAIAVAEREYTSKKNKINTKEEELDLKAQELDAEISALTTEYDTVKSLISKNVEKTFTLFNN